MADIIPYGIAGMEVDTFTLMTTAKVKNASNPQGDIDEMIYAGFEPFLTSVMSAGSLSKEKQTGQILRLQYAVGCVLRSIPKVRYNQVVFSKILGTYSICVTKITQSTEGSGNLVQRIKTMISITQATTKHEEKLQAKGRLR